MLDHMGENEYRLAAVVYADIVGFSRMMAENESGAIELAEQQETAIRRLTEQFGGKIVKAAGGSYLLDFNNTVNAVKCSIAVQNETRILPSLKTGQRVQMRIGVHLGDISFSENDAFGEGIDIASGLQAVARPGRICISRDVYNLVSDKVDLRSSPLGEIRLDNISRPVEAYEIAMDPSDILDRTNDAAEPFNAESLKREVLRETKLSGHRLSIEEARKRLDVRSADGERVLRELVAKGILIERATRSAEPAHRGGWEHWAEGIAREIENHVREHAGEFERMHGASHSERHAARRAARHAARDAVRAERRAGIWDPEAEFGSLRRSWMDFFAPGGTDDRSDETLVAEYRDYVAKRAERARHGFRGHLTAYLGVNAMLAVVWATTGAGFPWFLIPAGAWAIGLLTHWSSARRTAKDAREIESVENLNREHLGILRKLSRVRQSWSSHLVSNLAASGFLVMLNLLTSPAFPWAIFPVGGMLIGLFSHFPVYKGKERSLKKRLGDVGADVSARLQSGTGRRPVAHSSGDLSVGRQAAVIREAIVVQIKSFGKGESPLGEDFIPLLDNYVNQITELEQKDLELEQIINGIPIGELEKDLQVLTERRRVATDQRVAEEYARSIEQIQKQQQSFRELKNEKEMLHLRTNSALNSLKQMQIDLARMKSISSGTEASTLLLLKERSGELSQYLEDFREGYRQLD